MRRHTRQAGFTLIELLVAAVPAAILALTAGAMIVFSFQAWRRHLALAEMQGDFRAAFPTLCMAIREGRNADLVTPAVGASGARLTIGRRSFYRANSARSYDPAGRLLVYDPDTGTAGNEIILSRGRVEQFVCTRYTNSVSFYLALSESGERMEVTNSVAFFRN